MSVEELIDEIKSLEAEERAKVLSYFVHGEESQEPGHMADEKFERLAALVIERHADLLQKLAQ